MIITKDGITTENQITQNKSEATKENLENNNLDNNNFDLTSKDFQINNSSEPNLSSSEDNNSPEQYSNLSEDNSPEQYSNLSEDSSSDGVDSTVDVKNSKHLGDSINSEKKETVETNCLALTVRKDYNFAIAKNTVFKTIRMSIKVAISTFVLHILRLFF